MLSFLISALIILFFPTFLNVNKEDYELDLLLNLYAPIPLLEDADEDEDEDEDEGGEQHNDQVAEVTNVEQHKDNWFEQEIYYKVIWCLALDSVASEFQNLTILSTKRFGKPPHLSPSSSAPPHSCPSPSASTTVTWRNSCSQSLVGPTAVHGVPLTLR
ncbi:hypothetical protein JHK84_042885 [Glycine max]|nr:hypothetical protein JHK84_042885 [Glycine max]